MASCKIKPIKFRLDIAIDYIKNDDKTDRGDLISGIHCIPDEAYENMKDTKEKFDKKGGVLGYHLIQSFKPGEVDYDTAHSLGVELVKRTLGDKYRAVITTHINCNHVHNHIIWDSVSHIDGKKYISSNSAYYKFREISDQLCQEHGLSIIEPKNKGLHYKEWLAIKEGNSWKQMMKSDIDTTINNSNNYAEFVKAIKNKGYELKEGKHLAFRHKGYKRFVRGKTLGIDFTREGINARIDMNRMGFKTITFKSETKTYSIKNLTGNKFFFKNKSLLEINIQLGMKIIMMILRNYPTPKTKRSQYIKNYNEAVIDKLSSQLKLVGDYKIADDKKLDHAADSIDKKIISLKDRIMKSDKNIKILSEAVDCINIMQKNEPYKKKKLFGKSNEMERSAYEAANKKLNKLGINYSTDRVTVLKRFEKLQEKAHKLKVEYKNCKIQKSHLNELKNTIKKVQNRDYPFGIEVKNRNIQKKHDLER